MRFTLIRLYWKYNRRVRMFADRAEPEFVDFIFHKTIAPGLATPTSTHSRKNSFSSSPLRPRIKRPNMTPLQQLHSRPFFAVSIAASPTPSTQLSPKQLKSPSRHHRPVTQTSESGYSLSPKYIQSVKKKTRKRGLPIKFQVSCKNVESSISQENDKAEREMRKIKRYYCNDKERSKDNSKQVLNSLRIRNNLNIYKGNFSSFSKKMAKNQKATKLCHLTIDSELSPWEIGERMYPLR